MMRTNRFSAFLVHVAALLSADLLGGCKALKQATYPYPADAAPVLAEQEEPCRVRPFKTFEIYILHNRAYMRVRVNDVNTIGVIDTAAEYSLITPALAQAAHMPISKTTERMRGVTGSFNTTIAQLDTIGLGSVLIKRPQPTLVYDFPGGHGKEIGVQIGADWLSNFDWDFDFPHRTGRPFLVMNCARVDPPWRTTFTGLQLTPLGVIRQREGIAEYGVGVGLVTIPVAFEGGVLDATFDTGATSSLLSHEAAHAAGVTNSQLDGDPVVEIGGLSGDTRRVYLHTFKDVAIGEQQFHNVAWKIARHFDRRDDPMILGMDYIGKEHIWLSYATGALYIDSGEQRKPVHPFDMPHQISGPPQPMYPEDVHGESATVQASCMVGTDGSISGCAIKRSTGNPKFAKEVLNWLTSGYSPVMQPAYVDGKPVRQAHLWQINFMPDDKRDPQRNTPEPPQTK